MTVFEHPIWKYVAKYAHLADGRDNVDLLQLPDDLREHALAVKVNCAACGQPMNPFRARVLSNRSRVAGGIERRLFYSGTCPSEANAGCSRTTAAQDHKNLVKQILAKPVLAPIDDFRGEYRWLSNFHVVPIYYEGIAYISTEHAYQAAKSLDVAVRQKIAALATCREAKREGGKILLRSDWESAKVGVMLDVLRLKFAHADLAAKLVATAGRELIEGNTWGDRFWGVCNGVGENWLGKLLMKIRDALCKPVRLLVTGSRDWTDEVPIRAVLVSLPLGSTVIHGAARGADAIADRVARELGINVEAHKADWNKNGRAAGPIRNQVMLEQSEPTLAAAFPLPQSIGTWDMVRRLRSAGIVVAVYGEPPPIPQSR